MKILTREATETIRKRHEQASKGKWLSVGYGSEGGQVKSYEILAEGGGETIAKFDNSNGNAPSNIEFIRHAHTDIPKLLAEVERLRNLLTHIEVLSDEFFEIEVINGKLMYVVCEDLEEWSDLLREISITSNKAVNA